MTVQYDDTKSFTYDAAGQMSPLAYRAAQPSASSDAASSERALSEVASSEIDVSDEAPESGTVSLPAAAVPVAAVPVASLPVGSPPAAALPVAGSLLSEVVAISTASSALPSCADADQMLRVATELARDVIGLSRVSFFIRDPSAERLLFRGSWATRADGSTRADHDTVRELSVRDGLALQNLRESGSPALCRARSAWFVADGAVADGAVADGSVADGSVAGAAGTEGGALEGACSERNGSEAPAADDAIMVTPLFASGHLVGMMCNDASHGQLPEPGKQAAAAVLCGMVAIDYVARRGPVRFQPLGVATAPSQLVQRIRDAIDENPARRGKDLAVEFNVSPGHLARAFKREMGLSLVDYRNRKRIDRFWDTLRRRGRAYSLKQAAFDAGFGSYAQFNRIHKKLVGVGPRLGARRTEATPFEAQDGAEAAS